MSFGLRLISLSFSLNLHLVFDAFGSYGCLHDAIHLYSHPSVDFLQVNGWLAGVSTQHWQCIIYYLHNHTFSLSLNHISFFHAHSPGTSLLFPLILPMDLFPPVGELRAAPQNLYLFNVSQDGTNFIYQEMTTCPCQRVSAYNLFNVIIWLARTFRYIHLGWMNWTGSGCIRLDPGIINSARQTVLTGLVDLSPVLHQPILSVLPPDSSFHTNFVSSHGSENRHWDPPTFKRCRVFKGGPWPAHRVLRRVYHPRLIRGKRDLRERGEEDYRLWSHHQGIGTTGLLGVRPRCLGSRLRAQGTTKGKEREKT